MLLSEVEIGDSAIITKVMGRGALRKRITEMGFVKGKKVLVKRVAPLADPIEFEILGYDISLRKSEARLIEVTTENEVKRIFNEPFNSEISETYLNNILRERSKTINVALVGNPNSGKTTLFNFASNSHERVGNYGGVTVDSKTATFNHKGYTINITDLPGTYSMSAYSPEEVYVRRYIYEEIPDVVINVLDASNLERNLYLTTQLIDMDVKVVVALNMYDELQKFGAKFNYQNLGSMIGIPFVPTVSSKGIGIRELFDKVINLYSDKERLFRHVNINYGEEIEESIKKLQVPIENEEASSNLSPRFVAIKLLENDADIFKAISNYSTYTKITQLAEKERKRLETIIGEDSETLITDARYGFISGALKETYKEGSKVRHKKTQIIDSVLAHRFWGFPIFFFFLWVMFHATFTLGETPKVWLENIVSFTGKIIDTYMPPGALNDMLTDGILSGVGGVIVFLPNILLLFFFISLMEDTGYMARAAFIMDKLMHKIGLHGKSFIPLIMGFGCNVPAIMATRTIENKSNRLLTILINPFMSCSARLPVYLLFISAFFPNKAGTLLFLIYIIGILVAIGVALLFKNMFFKVNEIPFVMELPPYRLPTIRSTLKHMWRKGEQYLKKMGGVILVASIIIWALGYFPRNENNVASTSMAQNVNEGHNESYIGKIGKAIEPVMRPLGFDWQMSVSLLTGIAAKEVVVGTMGVLYQADHDKNQVATSLQTKLKEHKYNYGPKKGQAVFTPLVVVSFLLFVLLYFPCIASMAAIKRETNSIKWTLFVITYTTAIAWFVSFTVYQTGSLLGF
jgi:ferrous iron transport protein B